MPLLSVLSENAPVCKKWEKKKGLRYLFSILVSDENLGHTEHRSGTGLEQGPSQGVFL